MTIQTTQNTTSLLEVYPVGRIRRNHGFEHATLHVLGGRFPRLSIAGHSDAGGFWIVGEVATEDLTSAVQEALRRLQSGEARLAVHPNCGTNFATAGTMAGVAAALAMFGSGSRLRDKFERLPLAATVATLALMVAQPVGMFLQERVTTSGTPGGLEIVEIRETRRGKVKVHRIVTRG
jgi:hypothetical protein